MEHIYWIHTRNVIKSFIYKVETQAANDKFDFQLRKLIFILKCYAIFLKNIKKKKVVVALADQRPLVQDYLNISTKKKSTYLFGGVISNFHMVKKNFIKYEVLWEKLPNILIVFNYEPNREIINESISKTLPIIVLGILPSDLEKSLWYVPYDPILLKEYFFFSRFFSRFI